MLEKRTFDARLYDINCSSLLSPGETITTLSPITADQGGLVIGTGTVNTVALSYPNNVTAAIGKVIQVEISAGVIPEGSDSQGRGVPNLACTVRARFQTSMAPNQIEATVCLLLCDQPGCC